MPELTIEQIKEKIAGGAITSLTVDTCIFDKYGCNLDFAIFSKLDQFSDGHIKIIFSEIIIGEITSHIEKGAAKALGTTDTQRELSKAIRQHTKRWKLDTPDNLSDLLQLEVDPKIAAEEQVEQFVDSIGAEIVTANRGADIAEEVLRRYFASEAPFEASENKKHEFPDAFALLSLEEEAKDRETVILCISTDNGWRDFAKASDHLVCMDDLNAALAIFNEAGKAVADHVLNLLRQGTAPNVQASIESAFEYRLDDNDYEIDVWSAFELDPEPLSAVLQWVDWPNAREPVVIAEDADSVTFTLQVQALVGFEASFAISVRDSIDRDYVSLGSEESYVEEKHEFQLALTVSRDLQGEPEVIEAEVANQRLTVNFGNFEPFANENPTHEKY